MAQAASTRWPAMLLVCLLALPLVARAEPLPDHPIPFVEAALHDMAGVLAGPTGAGTRSERLRGVVARYFDLAALSHNCIGPAWLLLSSSQQNEFKDTVESYLITGYVGSLDGGLDGVSFGTPRLVDAPKPAATTLADDDDRKALVRFDVRGADGSPHPVLIALYRGDDGYRIVDVSAEAISLGRLLADDFRAFLRRNVGGVEALVAVLRGKIAARTAVR